MSFDYSRSVATATRLIERYGAPLAIRREGTSGGPAYEPSRASPEFLPAVGVRNNRRIYDREAKITVERVVFMVKASSGLVVTKGDKLMFSGASSFLANPQQGAFVAEYSIISIEPLSPGDTVIHYEIVVES